MPTTESSTWVVDTNVWVVAELGSDADPECHIRCLEFIYTLRDGKDCIAVDSNFLIFKEYFRLLSQQLVPYQILTSLLPQGRVLEKQITVDNERVVLPDEIARIVHDPNEHKFVAVSLSFSPPVPIVNATDSDWLNWEDELLDHGIEVKQLCRTSLKPS